MKLSQFNSIIPYGEKYALYNSLNQNVIFIEDTLCDILKASSIEGVVELKSIHPGFYEALLNGSFIVPLSKNEIEDVKVISSAIDNSPSKFWLTINPTMNCNFKCWYCYETHIKSSRVSEIILQNIRKFISNTVDKNDSLKLFNLSFFGGEPLLYFEKDVSPIIEHFSTTCEKKNRQYSISFTTNGFLINQQFIDFFHSRNLSCSLQITLDGYGDTHDKVRFVSNTRGSYREIIDNIKLLIKNNFFVRLRVNYTEANIQDCWRIADEFTEVPEDIKKHNLIFDFHRVWQDNEENINDKLDKTIHYIRAQSIDVSSKFSPNNVQDSCYADKFNSAVINYNGDVFKCTARDFTTAKREGYLDNEGEIIWENDAQSRRMNAKFNNKPCLECRIMPLCNGGCSQHALENEGTEYCVYGGDESEKDNVVKAKIDELVLSNSR